MFDKNGEDSTVKVFFSETCHCTLGTNNAPCSQALPRRYAVEYREQCLELSKTERDIAILGQLAALRRREPTIAVVSDPARIKNAWCAQDNTQFFDLETWYVKPHSCFYMLSP